MIIVTGGAGFIGSVLIKRLNDQGINDILVVDRMEQDKKWLNLRGLKYHSFVHADEFLDSKWMVGNQKINAIYHMGACSSTTETDVDYLMKNNVEFSKTLFAYASEKQVPICYASSAATYGLGDKGYSDDHHEVDKLRPLNAYGYSKQVVDQWILDFCVPKGKLPPKWFGVKFFNVFGPNEYHKDRMASVVFQAFNQIQETGKVKLFKSHRDDYKDGEQKRDFVYVLDVVDAMIALMNCDKKDISGIYNLGAGKARTFYDLVKATFNAMEKKESIVFIDMPEDLRNQYQYFTEAKMHKLKAALPNFQFHSLEEGVKDYVQNYLMSENPYMDLEKGSSDV